MSTHGPAFDPHIDGPRLQRQQETIRAFMGDGRWRTLAEISEQTGFPEASISAQLRHLRKPQFGAYQVEKRRRDGAGLWEYRVLPPRPKPAIAASLFDAPASGSEAQA